MLKDFFLQHMFGCQENKNNNNNGKEKERKAKDVFIICSKKQFFLFMRTKKKQPKNMFVNQKIENNFL